MAWNKVTLGRALVGALIIGSSPGGKRGVGGNQPLATPSSTSPTPIYNFSAPTFALTNAVMVTARNIGAATIAANTSGDIFIPLMGVNLNDILDFTPQFVPTAGVGWGGFIANAAAVAARGNTTAYIIGEIVKVTISAVVYAFACSTSGTTAGSAAAFTAASAVNGALTTDGTAVWTCLGTNVGVLRIYNGTVGAITISTALVGNWTAEWYGLSA